MAKVVKHNWHLFDASGQVVGRFSTHISNLLRGKYKPTFTGNKDCGDTVVIVNAEKVTFTGKKWEQKIYYKHSGYIGGLKETKASHLKEKYPERVLLHSIRGMLPKTHYRLPQLQRLHVYAGPEHPFKHMFPNQPKLAKTEDKVVKVHEHFQVLPEFQAQIEKSVVPIPAEADGSIDSMKWLRRNHPKEFEEFMEQQEVRLTPAEYKDYLVTRALLKRSVSLQKRIDHAAKLERQFKFGTKLDKMDLDKLRQQQPELFNPASAI